MGRFKQHRFDNDIAINRSSLNARTEFDRSGFLVYTAKPRESDSHFNVSNLIVQRLLPPVRISTVEPYICVAIQENRFGAFWPLSNAPTNEASQNMKTLSRLAIGLAATAISLTLAHGQMVYTGPGVADGGGPGDGGAISSVDIANTASTITFTINSTEAMQSYIFFAIEIQDGPGGQTSLTNPWGPSAGISTGMNALVNTYGSGASALTYSGGIWTQNASGGYDAGGTGSTYATMTFALSSLGLSVGSTFNFDVVSSYTNPSKQAAYGALDNTGYLAESDGSYMPWLGTNYYDSATAGGSTLNSYTITAVPEPRVTALLGLGGLMMAWRRWRTKAC